MRTVEHAQFRRFIGRHVGHDLRADGIPRGARPANLSSITHWLKGSVITTPSSRIASASTSARSASVVAGTMRSTMLHGKVQFCATQSTRSG
jgi:hypothetical protein